MFNYLKKSPALKFLCSACLICSFGALSNVYAENAASVGSTYMQANFGNEARKIKLNPDAKLTSDGKLSGELKFLKGIVDDYRYSYESWSNKDLDEAVRLSRDLILANNGYIFDNTGDETTPNWQYSTDNRVTWNGSATTNEGIRQIAWDAYKTSANYSTDSDKKEKDLIKVGWAKGGEKHYRSLANDDENSKMALFLQKAGNEIIGATKTIPLAGGSFVLSDVQFYDATEATAIDDNATAAQLSVDPGKYEVLAILTEKGDKTIISGPVVASND